METFSQGAHDLQLEQKFTFEQGDNLKHTARTHSSGCGHTLWKSCTGLDLDSSTILVKLASAKKNKGNF